MSVSNAIRAALVAPGDDHREDLIRLLQAGIGTVSKRSHVGSVSVTYTIQIDDWDGAPLFQPPQAK